MLHIGGDRRVHLRKLLRVPRKVGAAAGLDGDLPEQLLASQRHAGHPADADNIDGNLMALSAANVASNVDRLRSS